MNLPWAWHHIESKGQDPSTMDIQAKASMVSSAIAERDFTEPDFEVRDRSSEIQEDNFNWKYFPDVCIQAFREKFQGYIPLVFNGDFKLTNESGSESKRLTVSYGGASSLSTSPKGVYTLEDEDSREELHNCTLAELQIALNTPIIQDASGDDSDSGLPEELQKTGVQHVVEFGEVHKSSIPLHIIQKLPFIILQEKDLEPEILKEQWGLIRKASELGNLQDMKEVKEKFVQRFHWQHAAVKGMLHFMDDLQHFQTFNKDASVEKADSDVSSEHFMDANMGTLIQSMRPSVQEEK